MNEPLLIRADASVQIGTGHVMRCLALAQAWQDDGGTAHFAVAEGNESLAARLHAEHCSLHRITAPAGSDADARETAEMAQSLGARHAVIDGYRFRVAHQDALRTAGARVLAIDDNAEIGEYTADLILNQNLHATESLYRHRARHTELLLGLRYALLRREFRAARAPSEPVPSIATRILVTLGGSDPHNTSERVLDALARVNLETEVCLAIGGANPHRASLEAVVARMGRAVRVVTDAPDMAELMAWCHLAVSGAGSTCWELARLGVPIAGIVVAPNQRGVASRLSAAGVLLDLGEHATLEPAAVAAAIDALCRSHARRTAMRAAGQALVDGSGAARVVARLTGRSEESVATRLAALRSDEESHA